MRNLNGLKPQDVLLMLKMLSGKSLLQKDLADSLGLSQAEISHSLQRLSISRLLDSKGEVNRNSALEFLVHGLKYVFPASFGPIAVGMPTAYSHPKLKSVSHEEIDRVVWPDPNGSVKGQSLRPIYESATIAAQRDAELYELLSLVDMIRVGRIRESKFASKKLQEKLHISE